MSTPLLLATALFITQIGSGDALRVQPPLLPPDKLVTSEQQTSTFMGSPDDPAPGSVEGGADLKEQLIRTVLGLGFVVALIYFLGRVVMPKALKLAPVGSGKSVRVVERINLDSKHALFLVDVAGVGKILLGTSESSVQLISQLSTEMTTKGGNASEPSAMSSRASASFQTALARATHNDERASDTAMGSKNEVTHEKIS